VKHFVFLLTLIISLSGQAADLGRGLRLMPVQDNGRIKPYDTFAQETLEVVYGKKKYEERAAWEVVLTWMLAPQVWGEKELFEVRNPQIQKALGLDEHRRWFKGEEVFGNERFPELMSDLRSRRETKEKLTPYFQALQRIESQFFVFREMAEGHLLRVMPSPKGDAWLSVADLESPAREAFGDVTQKFVLLLGSISTGGLAADNASLALDQSVAHFQELVHAANTSGVQISQTGLEMELFYNDFHPFRWAYIFYLIAALCGIVGWILDQKAFSYGAWAFTIIGFLTHTFGFALRVYLAGRPPVSNMYETVVWVPLGTMFFGFLLGHLQKNRMLLLCSGIVAIQMPSSRRVFGFCFLRRMKTIFSST